MRSRIVCVSALFFTWAFLSPTPVIGDVNIVPHGLGIALQPDQEATRTLTLSNNSEHEVAFRIWAYVPEEERQRRPGPRRDDLGDQIAKIAMDKANWTGLAWDGELMWGMNCSDKVPSCL